MANYRFYIDTKSSIWTRSYRQVEASSEEEAKRLAKEIFKGDDGDGEYEVETLYDTQESISVEENMGFATEELYFDEGRNDILLMDNRPLDIIRDEKINKILQTTKWDITHSTD